VLFLDYVAVGQLRPTEMAEIVAGVAEGCRRAGCALAGGEMAEMPGLYLPGEFDVAGFCVGLAERARLIDGSAVKEGDVVIGLTSSGLHSNGFSLVRAILQASGLTLSDRFDEMSQTIADTLLTPTRIYVRGVLALLERSTGVRAMAHITGGGMAGNLSRVIPTGLSARLHFANWTIPPVFLALQRLGGVSGLEMFRTFNMGIGYVLVVSPDEAAEAVRILAEAGEEPVHLGDVVAGEPAVTMEGIT
jgi:phosphoribosylformylglycinamidine cyclo-ligase